MAMQRAGTAPLQHASPFFTTTSSTSTTASPISASTTNTASSFFSNLTRSRTNAVATTTPELPDSGSLSSSRSRPGTSNGDKDYGSLNSASNSPAPPNVSVFEFDREKPRVLTKSKERKTSFGRSRKASFGSPSRSKRSPSTAGATGTISISTSSPTSGSSSTSNFVLVAPNGLGGAGVVITDSAAPPALPEFALSANARVVATGSRESEFFEVKSPTASVESFSKMLSRTAPTPVNGYSAVAPSATAAAAAAAALGPASSSAQTTEAAIIHSHVQETANKRISTMDYLRKAHEGRAYWFNTLLFTQADLTRLPSFASARIARRATNYLLLGLSLPSVIDFNANTPLEFLRALNVLLAEFDTFQTLHSDGSSNSGSLSRARLPQMFRRVPGGKTRRTSGQASDIGLPMGASSVSLLSSGAGGGSSDTGSGGGTGGGGAAGEGMMQFGASESELLPGEEYTYLLTPSLPFDPDFFETFATLCDVLIDAYAKLMSLLSSPRECTSQVAELFAKADSKVRKIIVQGCVKEFEDYSRAGIKTEVASVGKVVLGGLM